MIRPHLEARAKIQKYFRCSFFGSNENFKICFRDLLTFSNYISLHAYRAYGNGYGYPPQQGPPYGYPQQNGYNYGYNPQLPPNYSQGKI